MKKYNYLFLAAIVLVLAACTNDENDNLTGNGPVAAVFTGNIETTHVTRMADTDWEKDNRIGITGKSGEVQYTNIPYKATEGGADGKFEPVDKQIYFQNLDTVNFTSYYPYNDFTDTEKTEGTKIKSDTKEQSEQKNFDFLYGTGKGSKSNSIVTLDFSHRMSKVCLTVKCGSDVSFTDLKKAVFSLGNLVHEGTFDYADEGSTALTGSAVSDWAFQGNDTETQNVPAFSVKENEGAETITYTLILFPQEFLLGTLLKFTASIDQGGDTGKQTFSANIDLSQVGENGGNKLVAGTQYNIPITIKKTSLTVGTPTIEPWETKELGGIDAEM